MMVRMHWRARDWKTLLGREHRARRVGKKRGTRVSKDCSMVVARVVMRSMAAPDSRERSELMQLLRERERGRTDDTVSCGHADALPRSREARVRTAWRMRSQVSSDSVIDNGSRRSSSCCAYAADVAHWREQRVSSRVEQETEGTWDTNLDGVWGRFGRHGERAMRVS